VIVHSHGDHLYERCRSTPEAFVVPARPRRQERTTMSVLTVPRHPLVATPLGLARQWCEGHIVDRAPPWRTLSRSP